MVRLKKDWSGPGKLEEKRGYTGQEQRLKIRGSQGVGCGKAGTENFVRQETQGQERRGGRERGRRSFQDLIWDRGMRNLEGNEEEGGCILKKGGRHV